MRSFSFHGSTRVRSLGVATLVGIGVGIGVGVGLLWWKVMPMTHDKSAAAPGEAVDACESFEWRASAANELALRLRLVAVDTGTGLDDLRVRACARASRCEQPLAEAITRAGGFAAIAIGRSALQTKSAASSDGFDGFLLVDGGSRHQPQVIIHSAPLRHAQCEVLRLTSDAMAHAIEVVLSAPVVETRAIVQAQMHGHHRHTTPSARIEVWDVTGVEHRLCDDCRVLYPGQNGAPDPAQTQLSTHSAAPAWLVLTPREALFVARDSTTQRVIAAAGPATLLPGQSLHVVLAPASTAQLAALPMKVRYEP